jgi:hypothetical protein
VKALPALVTRGANPVFLFANHGLIIGIGGAPGNGGVRWTRNGTHLCNTSWGGGAGTNLVLTVPTLPWLDVVPAAGSYVYQLEVFLGTGVSSVYFDATNTGCGLLAFELG